MCDISPGFFGDDELKTLCDGLLDGARMGHMSNWKHT